MAVNTRGYFAAAILAAFLGSTLGASTPALAQTTQNRPLKLAGKKTLYQRVLAVPGAALVTSPEDTNGAVQPVTPFTVFYVYARRTIDGKNWVQVGLNSTGGTDGWLPANETVDWKQALTVAFKDPDKQPRVLLFRNEQAPKRLAEQSDVAAYKQLRQKAINGDVADTPVVAIQPPNYIDIRHNFYLIPILNHEDVLVGNYPAHLLQVASVPLQAQQPYRTGIVFVIDTTVSMQPYIDRTRAIVQDVYQQLQDAGLADQVGYGLVAFRSSTKAVPALGYVSRVYSDLTTNGEKFLGRTSSVQAAAVSSAAFDEDAYAGINRAIEDINWQGYFARYIILITDAGPQLADSPLSATGLSTDALKKKLVNHGIIPIVIHLETPLGKVKKDYASAASAYRPLTTVKNIGSLYYPIETGTVKDFGTALSAMMKQLVAQVRAAAAGFQPLQAQPQDLQSAIGPDTPASPEQLGALKRKVARLGYALRLNYLHQENKNAVPTLFDAWVLDRDPANPSVRSLDVRVLLTRNQLSDLHDVLSRVLDKAEAGVIAPQNFLDQLKSLAAIVSRDPAAVGSTTPAGSGTTLADLGYMREYIEGLPYHSQVMNIDLSDWRQWSAQRQFAFINELQSKVAYYRALHDNLDLWVSLDGGPVDGDSVYPLLLEALP